MSEYTRRLRPRVRMGIRNSLSSSVYRKLNHRVSKTNRKKQVREIATQTTLPTDKATQTPFQYKIDEIEIVPTLTEPGAAFKPPIQHKRKKTRKKSKSEVHKLLKEAGVEDPEAVCLCLKAGISAGCVNFEIPNPLEQTILKEKCYSCDTEIVVKVRDVLHQGATGGSYWGGYDDDIICPNKECDRRFVVTEMCTFQPQLDGGKFYNHCEHCPVFGECIGDYRQSHCLKCDEHYYSGNVNQFKCSNCPEGRTTEDVMWKALIKALIPEY